MATLKEVQNKIQAVKKTKKITQAMNMVATSRLRGAQMRMEGFRPYADKFEEVLGSLASKSGEEANELLIPRDEVKNIHIILCTSDRGLCGGFNINLTHRTAKFIEEKNDEDVSFSFTNFGKKGRDYCRKKRYDIVEEQIGVVGAKFDFNVASITGHNIIDKYLEGVYDEVYIVYSEFVSMARQQPLLKQLLPIPPIEIEEDAEEDKSYQAEHICEPSPDELLSDMLPQSVFVQIYSALLETSTSEHAARMAAMENATKACDDMVENLTLVYNKARQAAITADLMDIVGGAEALKG